LEEDNLLAVDVREHDILRLSVGSLVIKLRL
jgi:hypothetical protein